MLQLCVKNVTYLHSSNRKLALKCHHYGKFGYPHLDSPSRLMNRRCKKVQHKKQCKSNSTSTSLIAHTMCRGPSSEEWYCNSESTRDISK